MPRRKNSGVHIRHGCTGTSGSKLLDATFDALCDYDRAQEALNAATDSEAREQSMKALRNAETDLEHCRKWHRDIISLTMQYIRQHGEVINIARLIDWLRQQDVPIHPDGSPGEGLTVRAVRNILRSAFSITGVRGRKPRN
jgi:hypothetical protein